MRCLAPAAAAVAVVAVAAASVAVAAGPARAVAAGFPARVVVAAGFLGRAAVPPQLTVPPRSASRGRPSYRPTLVRADPAGVCRRGRAPASGPGRPLVPDRAALASEGPRAWATDRAAPAVSAAGPTSAHGRASETGPAA